MDRTERFYIIERLLAEHRCVSFARLQEALGVSRATLKRDLQYLRDFMHAPIEYDRENNGYRFGAPESHAPRHELPGLWFNASEIHALLTMQTLLDEVQPGLLCPHIAPLRTRLLNLLGSRDDMPANVARRVRILRVARRRADVAHFEVIAAALMKRHRLALRHWNRAADQRLEREVSPQRLVYYRDNWYLDAWCHLRGDVRSFALDAIESAIPIEQTAREVADSDLDTTLGAGYGIFSGADVHWAKLRFAAASARWVSSETWHPQQKTCFTAEGDFLLELPYSNPTELVMDILRHGANVEVLEPESLRERVKHELRNALTRY